MKETEFSFDDDARLEEIIDTDRIANGLLIDHEKVNDPTVVIEAFIKIMINFDPNDHHEEDPSTAFALAYDREPESYNKIIKSKIANPDSFFEASVLLQAIPEMINAFGDILVSEEVTAGMHEKLISLLEEIVSTSLGENSSYFLKKRAEDLKKRIGDIKAKQEKEQKDPKPNYSIDSSRIMYVPYDLFDGKDFVIAPGLVADFDSDVLWIRKAREGGKKEEIPEMPKSLRAFSSEPSAQVDFKDFLFLISKPMRAMVKEEFGVALEELSLREQFHFLNFVKNKNEKEVQKVAEFCNNFGVTGMRAFLSLEYDKGFGEEIMTINSKEVFEKYCQIVDAADEIGKYIEEDFGSSGVSQPVIDRTVENMLQKAKDILSNFATLAKDTSTTPEDIAKKLESIRVETVTFVSTFKAVESDLRNIKSVSLEIINAQSVDEEDRKIMREIYEKNYADQPELQAKLLKSFDESFNNSDSVYQIFRHAGKVRGFYRLDKDKKESDKLTFGAFNIDPSYKGAHIGEALMQATLDTRAQSQIIKANCSQVAPIAMNYIERGFVATETYSDEGAPSLRIVRNEMENKTLSSKQLSQAEIIAQARVGEDYSPAGSEYVISCQKVSDINKLAFDNISPESGSKFFMTRYFKSKIKERIGGKEVGKAGEEGTEVECVIAVFEKISPEDLERYTGSTQSPA
jgi:predicted GNAT family N-acyltransferase